ncbi:unnamed protein product [Zymoseptoria tritici ST99CH_3D1]|nr:unnamed protein product [Zymoseptoria tritici ST99CH_3D1]
MLVLPTLFALLPALAKALAIDHSSTSWSGANASDSSDIDTSSDFNFGTAKIDSAIAPLIESPQDSNPDWDSLGGHACETDSDCSTACPVWLYGYCMAEMLDDFTPYTACRCIPRFFEGDRGFVWKNGIGVVKVQAVGV